jgi:hypothetical protein
VLHKRRNNYVQAVDFAEESQDSPNLLYLTSLRTPNFF